VLGAFEWASIISPEPREDDLTAMPAGGGPEFFEAAPAGQIVAAERAFWPFPPKYVVRTATTFGLCRLLQAHQRAFERVKRSSFATTTAPTTSWLAIVR
jgi:hypothetical protein